MLVIFCLIFYLNKILIYFKIMNNTNHDILFINKFDRKNTYSLTQRLSSFEKTQLLNNSENINITVINEEKPNNDSNYYILSNKYKTPLKKYFSGLIVNNNSNRKYSLKNTSKFDLNNQRKLSFNNQYKLFNNSKKNSSNSIISKFNIETKRNSKRHSLQNIIKNKINLDNIKKEEIDPLKIPSEDLIFNEPLLEIGKIKKKKKNFIFIKDNNLLKHFKQKKRQNLKENMNKTHLSPSDKILNKIYQNNILLENEVRVLKRNKQKYSLLHYQRKLINTAERSLPKKSIKKLKNAFDDLRNEGNKNIISEYNFIKQIEDEEKKIVDSINNSEESYLNLITSYNNYFISDKLKKEINLPKIKFKKINLMRLRKIKKEK